MYHLACPCGQGDYQHCCQPLHVGQAHAETASQLMRSRYSAFALQQIDYIVQTTALGQQASLNVDAITDWSKSNQWLKLEVLNSNEKLDKTTPKLNLKPIIMMLSRRKFTMKFPILCNIRHAGIFWIRPQGNSRP